MSQISVIIASRNEGIRLGRTVINLLEGLADADELLVVDDGSGDGSAASLEGLDDRVTVIRNETPRGVAGARNLGARHSAGDILVFADAHVSAPGGWVDPLIAALGAKAAGAAGPVIASEREPESQGWGLRFCDDATNLEWLVPRGPEPYPVPVLAGGFLGVRRQVFEDVDGFDAGMGAYGMDDQEFSMHVWVRGYSCVLVPAITVGHFYREQSDTPDYKLAWESCLTNVLRMGLVHFGRDRLARLFASYCADPCFPAALASAVAGDVGSRRHWVQTTRLRDDEWYFGVCNALAL